MSKKIKNGSNGDLGKKKPLKKKRMTKKDLENVIQDLKNKELRLRAEFDNFRKRKETEISSILNRKVRVLF